VLKVSAYALLVVVLVMSVFQFTTLGSDTPLGQVLRDIMPIAVTIVALAAGILLATLPEIHRHLIALFKGSDHAADQDLGEDRGQDQNQNISRETLSLASVGRALPLRQPSPSLSEPFPAKSPPGETARPGDAFEKTAAQLCAPNVAADSEINVKPGQPTHHTDIVPVEDLFNGVANALGSGLGAIIDTGAVTCKPVARAMRQGCKGAFKGLKSTLDFLDN